MGRAADVRRRLRVTGAVQGVGYRVACARAARQLGVAGYVRNLDDGSVEVVAQGPADAVGRLVAWCREGPAMARVRGVAVSEEPPVGGETGFVVAT